MPFYREWEDGEYIINRERTGPVPPPETGTTVQEDGAVVVANQTVTPSVPPATPVTVTFPGPNEPMVGKDGTITPRWWRFLDELYRRTGGVVDNINKAPVTYLAAGGPDNLILSGIVPTVSVTTNVAEAPATVSLSLSGNAPTVTVA